MDKLRGTFKIKSQDGTEEELEFYRIGIFFNTSDGNRIAYCKDGFLEGVANLVEKYDVRFSDSYYPIITIE